MPTSRPARLGQRRLTMLDSSTFRIAIELAASTVPGNSIAAGTAPRSASPAVSTASATSRVRSSPNRRFSHAAIPETTPKQITGVAASSDKVADDRCSRAARSGNSGGRLVIAVRRFSPAADTATTSSAVSYGRRSPATSWGISPKGIRREEHFFSRTNRLCVTPARRAALPARPAVAAVTDRQPAQQAERVDEVPEADVRAEQEHQHEAERQPAG